MTHNPPIVELDWDAFNEHVARLRAEHHARTPAEAVAASLEAFARWGVAPPWSFTEQHPEAAAARPVRAHKSRARS